jgi:transcriptional regulator with PAS, ATPase and Fis domain
MPLGERVEAHQGVLARCSPYGAVFLDEIGEVGEPVQIKLLHVLQDRLFCPVGSHEPVRFRGRVIAATNRPLETLRNSGVFRDDFFYRLCSDVIQVPPLRQRLQQDPGELRQLLQHLLARTLGESALEMLEKMEQALARQVPSDYAWPGNVRELEQAVRRILLNGEYQASRSAASQDLLAGLIQGIETHSLDADSLLAGYCALTPSFSP